jgi:hypothetical protein
MSADKTFIQANWFKLFIVAVVTLFILVYFFRSGQLDSCLELAQANYTEKWAKQCAVEKKGKDCDMLDFGGVINKAKDKAVDECFRRYTLFPR